MKIAVVLEADQETDQEAAKMPFDSTPFYKLFSTLYVGTNHNDWAENSILAYPDVNDTNLAQEEKVRIWKFGL
ncbi:hypothetical protein ACI7RC_21490 [Brevibacillus sp. B_LB10_24]|uniref:hypothetical protein n=1 Tax=Brevibacillus sp. B_LB10_24 TaxID=3380645 RepID=UPI0038B800B9